MDVERALSIADYCDDREHAVVVLAAEVRRLRELHQPETAEGEDVNGISSVTYCEYDGRPWPCPSIEPEEA